MGIICCTPRILPNSTPLYKIEAKSIQSQLTRHLKYQQTIKVQLKQKDMKGMLDIQMMDQKGEGKEYMCAICFRYFNCKQKGGVWGVGWGLGRFWAGGIIRMGGGFGGVNLFRDFENFLLPELYLHHLRKRNQRKYTPHTYIIHPSSQTNKTI